MNIRDSYIHGADGKGVVKFLYFATGVESVLKADGSANYNTAAAKDIILLLADAGGTKIGLPIPILNQNTSGYAALILTEKKSTNNSYYLTFVDSNNNSATAESVYTNAGIYFNPTTGPTGHVGTLHVNNISGDNIGITIGNTFVALGGTYTPATSITSSSDNNSVPGCKAVWDAILNGMKANDAMRFMGFLTGGADATHTTYTPAAVRGDTYKVSTAGYINGTYHLVNDTFICTDDSTALATSTNVSTIKTKWGIIESNGDYLSIHGGTMDGNITFSSTTGIRLKLGNTSNYAVPIVWLKNGTGWYKSDGTTLYANQPQIGQHNTGDTYGTIAILPYATDTSPWSGTVGLFIGKTVLKWENKIIAHAGNISNSDPIATIGTSETVIATIAGVDIKAKIGSYLPSNHTYSLSLATTTDSSSISLSAFTKYKLTAGGSTYVFTTPADTWRNIYVGGSSKVGTGNDTKAINVASSNLNITYLASGSGTGKSGSSDYFTINLDAKSWTGATSSAAGTTGYMPGAASADRGKYLRGDGSWIGLSPSISTGTNDNKIKITIGGEDSSEYTVPYSINSDTVDNYHADSFLIKRGIRSDKDDLSTLRWNFGGFNKNDYHGDYEDQYPYGYGMYLSLQAGTSNSAALMFFGCPAWSTTLGHVYVKTRGAGDVHDYSSWGTLAYITDNVASATKLQTARTLTIGNSSKTFDGTADVNWTLEEIGAAGTHTHPYLPLIGGTMVGNIIMDTGGSTELSICYDINRAKANGSGWAFSPMVCRDVSDQPFFNIGVYGTADVFNYAYMGTGSHSSTTNFRIYSNAIKFGNNLIAHAGNITNDNIAIGTTDTVIATIAGVQIKAKVKDVAGWSNDLVNVEKTLKVADWTTVATINTLDAGTYAIQITSGNVYASGIFSACHGSDSVIDEIPLHVSDSGTNTWRPYARISENNLQMTTSETTGTARTYTIKILKLI